ncbi:MAG: ABC transporter permease, partial [Candidatus Latescibacteria bacterium]|nr:ABC transporter permease [Candidatus Latescibacterota bacterium]
LFLSGRIAPIELLPNLVQQIANILPFRWAVAFPVELMLGRLSNEQIWHGFTMQGMWLVISLVLLKIVWRSGIKKYSAVGS